LLKSRRREDQVRKRGFAKVKEKRGTSQEERKFCSQGEGTRERIDASQGKGRCYNQG
jgi:hypothetical protein